MDSNDISNPLRCSFSTMLLGFFTRDFIISMGLRWFFTDSSSFNTSSFVLTSLIAQVYLIIACWNWRAWSTHISGTWTISGTLTMD